MPLDSNPALPPADIDQARAYLALLDPAAERHSFFTVDNAKPGGRERTELTRTLHGAIAALWPELCRLNRLGAGVYVTPNETNGRGRKAADIVRVRMVWVDDDKPREGPRSDFPLAPTVVVATSPGKYQYGWRVAGLTPDDHRGIMQTMVEAYGADPAAVALSCVLRLPGTRCTLALCTLRHTRAGVCERPWLQGFHGGSTLGTQHTRSDCEKARGCGLCAHSHTLTPIGGCRLRLGGASSPCMPTKAAPWKLKAVSVFRAGRFRSGLTGLRAPALFNAAPWSPDRAARCGY
jgi:hypothetical protein